MVNSGARGNSGNGKKVILLIVWLALLGGLIFWIKTMGGNGSAGEITRPSRSPRRL